MKIYKEISVKSIYKTSNLLIDIFNASNIDEYPLNWELTSVLPEESTVGTKEPDPSFSNLSTTYSQMTYIVPDGAKHIETKDLQKINVFNPIWERINYIKIGSESNIDISRTFIMINDTGATLEKMQILATFPGQNFNQKLTSEEFSNFTWYMDALVDDSLIISIDKQADPFYGGINNPSGFCKSFKIGTLQTVVGVLYNESNIETLISPLFSDQTSGEIKTYIYNPVSLLIKNDTDDIVDADMYNKIRSDPELNNSKIMTKEVFKSGDKYDIRNIENQSGSGALYKLVAVLSPDTLQSDNLTDYDYMIVLMQRNDVIEGFSQSLETEIQDHFWVLMGIVIGSSIVLWILIGMWVWWSTRKITSPIQKLTKLTSEITKEYKIEKIRQKIQESDLFENLKKKNTNANNQDEIEELISIFYNFFIDDTNDENQRNMLNVSNSEYPRNLFQSKAISDANSSTKPTSNFHRSDLNEQSNYRNNDFDDSEILTIDNGNFMNKNNNGNEHEMIKTSKIRDKQSDASYSINHNNAQEENKSDSDDSDTELKNLKLPEGINASLIIESDEDSETEIQVNANQ